MSGKFFLDTNIFVYSFDARSPGKAARASKLIKRAIETRRGIVSYQVVQEFFNVALRRFAKPMTEPEARQYLSVTFRPLLSVHSSVGLYGDALRVTSQFGYSWYDSLIIASAISGECETLYSEDFQNGQRIANLTISNPFLS
jgi:predicted nucleic acid-binding protein